MKILRYAMVGGFAATIDFLIFLIFAKVLELNYFWVGAAGFVIATTINYLLSIKFVFKSGARFSIHTEIGLVLMVSLVGLTVNQTILYISIELLQIELLISKILATASVFLWNYGMRNLYIFKTARRN